MAGTLAERFGAVTTGVRLGLGAADALHGLVGTRVMKGALDGMRGLSGGRLPKWSPALPRPVHFRRGQPPGASDSGERLVYFPSCAARNMGTQRGDDNNEALPVTAERLFRKAGFDVLYPPQLDSSAADSPSRARDSMEVADAKSTELEARAA